jgi:hypothetical protein
MCIWLVLFSFIIDDTRSHEREKKMTFTVFEVNLRLSASFYVSDLHIGTKDQNVKFPKLTDIF